MELEPIVKKKFVIPQCHKWNEIIEGEMQKPYMKELSTFLVAQREEKEIYPASKELFTAFKLTPFHKVCVVIIGNEPQANGTAHGLAYSSIENYTSGSLENIFKEIKTEYPEHCKRSPLDTSDLSQWARQGVLLLNRVLTVEKGVPDAHTGKGWETFTEAIITALNKSEKPLVYMLWGKKAQEVIPFIDKRNKILTAPHPSKHQADKGFFGCDHFLECNKFLTSTYGKRIFWWELTDND